MGLFNRVKKTVKSKDRGTLQEKRREIEKNEGGTGETIEKQVGGKKRLGRKKAPFVKSDMGRADRVITSPLISEKATDLVSQGHYVFKVKSRANKTEVRKAIAHLYGVTVIGIRMVILPGKRRRLGRSRGYRAGYKKAIVRIKKGEKIEVLPQ